nr:uncharacterized protein LOC104098079 isoform X2 [Nicotiana tomentosiformis]
MVDSTTSKRVTRGLSATMEAERRTKIRNYSMKQGCSYRVSFLMHMHGVDPIDILLQVMVSSTRINDTWRYLNSVKDNNHQRELYTFITTHRKHWLQKPNIAVGLSIWMLSLGLATAWCSNSTILAHHVTQQSSILKQPALFSNQLYLHRQLKQLLLRRLTTLVSL